ncbi:MAG: glycerophosphoryl diester phosphodiesterase [Rhodospirillales bacterium]|nr:glycerophosphoryl diester phosphodiesterase [Rhodospirillales bacterium]
MGRAEPLLILLPPVIGHRGAAARAPENTLAGLRHAAALGVTWIEIDARLARDGEVVVFHDSDLTRIAGRAARISDIPLADLTSVDAGRHFGAAFAGETIPTLAALLDLATSLGLGVNVELKTDLGREAELARNALTVIAAAARPGSILVSSFDAVGLAAAAHVEPALPRGLIIDRAEDAPCLVATLGCVSIHLNQRWLDAETVRWLKDSGLQVAAFTVNDPARARVLWDWGVDAVFSDVPDVLLALRRN